MDFKSNGSSGGNLFHAVCAIRVAVRTCLVCVTVVMVGTSALTTAMAPTIQAPSMVVAMNMAFGSAVIAI